MTRTSTGVGAGVGTAGAWAGAAVGATNAAVARASAAARAVARRRARRGIVIGATADYTIRRRGRLSRTAARQTGGSGRASGSWPRAARPPSTAIVAPVTKLAASERRCATTAATSSGRPGRPRAWRPLSASSALGVEPPGRDRPERHGVDADPARAVLDGDGAREALDRGLGGGVRRSRRGPRRCAWWEETLTIAPGMRAARKRRTAVAQPTTAGARFATDEVEHLRGRGGVERGVAEQPPRC